MNITKALIPVAGLGTRFRPITKALPKEMLPIIDRPILDYILDECRDSGIRDVWLIVGQDRDVIVNYYGNKKDGMNIHYICQEEPLGLGHAISLAEDVIQKEPFAVLLGDEIFPHQVPVTKRLMEGCQEKNQSFIGVKYVETEEVSSYGIVDGLQDDAQILITYMVEKPEPDLAPSRIAAVGRYVLMPSIFPILKTLTPGKHGEMQLTDGLKLLLEQEGITGIFLEGPRFDVGSKIGYILANMDIAFHHEEYHDNMLDFIKKHI